MRKNNMTDITDETLSTHIKHSIKKTFSMKFPLENFELVWENYKAIECFSALGNIYDNGGTVDKPTHFVMRLVATWHIDKALRALKFDTEKDPNLLLDDECANIGTPGRIAKIWGGNGLDSENIREYGDGRWTKTPRLAAFPAEGNEKRRPVTVVLDTPGIGSVCSHHFLPYSILNTPNSGIVISYIPKGKLLGLSKIGVKRL